MEGQGRDPDWAPGSRISSPSDHGTKGHTGLEHPARRPIAGGYAIQYRELGTSLTRTTLRMVIIDLKRKQWFKGRRW